MAAVNKEASRPLYLQIQAVLEEKILSGKWKAGEKAMSENEIAAKYQVSRVTARQAIEKLVAKNMLYRRPGKGTFVSEQGLAYGFSTMLSFSRSLQAKGFTVETRILDQGAVPASEEIAEKLRLTRDAEVVIIRRLRIVDGIPAAIHASYFSARIYSRLINTDVARESPARGRRAHRRHAYGVFAGFAPSGAGLRRRCRSPLHLAWRVDDGT